MTLYLLELEIVRVVLELIQLRQHRDGVLCPEHDAVDNVRRQGDLTDLMEVHRVADAHIALPKPVKKPVGVVGGQVGSPARADDHDFSPFRVGGRAL